jgi:pyruvate-formate lyase-activating enzyme
MPVQLSRTRPQRIVVQVTDRCNATCRHCAYECADAPKPPIDRELVELFLSAFTRRWGTPKQLGLTGGEPMLFPEVTLQLAKLASARGITVRLMTNASWACNRKAAHDGVLALKAAGVSGLWISAGAFHAEHIAERCHRELAEAAGDLGLHYYANFTYLHPAGEALRSRGLPAVRPTIAWDETTLRLHEAFAREHAQGTHGWTRVWDLGRARALFDALGKGAAHRARRDLGLAANKGIGDLYDLVGLGLHGQVFYREHVIGQTKTARFDRLFAKIHPRTTH